LGRINSHFSFLHPLISLLPILLNLTTVKEEKAMGDIGYIMPQTFTKQELSSGWSFKQADDTSKDAWLPVKTIPSTVQQDLLDHKKYVSIHNESLKP
jgi:hypothetical protein